MQDILESLFEQLARGGPGSYYTLEHLRFELGRRLRIGLDDMIQQMECDADMSYSR